MAGQDAVEHVAGVEDFLGLNLDIGDLPTHLAVRLVNHNLGVGQGEAFALGAAGQEDRSAAGSQPYAVGADRAGEDLHRVVDGQGSADAAAGRIDVEVDVLAAVLALQVQKLHHQFVSVAVVDLALQEDDPIFQQQVAQGQLTLALIVAVGGLGIDRNRPLKIAHNRFPFRRESNQPEAPARSSCFSSLFTLGSCLASGISDVSSPPPAVRSMASASWPSGR